MKKILLSALLALQLANANTECDWQGNCISGFVNFQSTTQQSQNWCWAAAIEMVLRNQGVNFSQQDALIKVYGTIVDRPANVQQIMHALDGWKPSSMGGAVIQSQMFPIYDYVSLINLLDANKPLVVALVTGGAIGHAYVLSAIRWVRTPQGPYPVGVVLRDPWPTNPSRQEWQWNAFTSHLTSAVSVYVMNMPVPQNPYQQMPGQPAPFDFNPSFNESPPDIQLWEQP